MPRIASLLLGGMTCLVVALIFIPVGQTAKRSDTHLSSKAVAQVAQSLSGPLTQIDGTAPIKAPMTYTVNVREPSGPPRIELAGVDPQGRSGSVACSTCHAVRKPNVENVSAATLDEFHQGMTFNHGKIACYACHSPLESDSLHLADGAAVSYEHVMTLCSQCHGPQATAFAHDAHGGMNGHWDLTRGPQTKNNCIDCHDPHEPKYPKMIVGFKPIDRFNERSEDTHKTNGADSHDNH